MQPVKDIKIKPGMSISELLEQFIESGGFAAKYLGMAARILEAMIKDEKCCRFLSFVGAPIATGLRGAIVEAIKRIREYSTEQFLDNREVVKSILDNVRGIDPDLPEFDDAEETWEGLEALPDATQDAGEDGATSTGQAQGS